MAFRNYILLFALVTGTISGPINVQDGDVKCAKTCTESLSNNAKFQYMPGNTYTYTYEGNTETRLNGPSSDLTSLGIRATADIEVMSTCEFALKLRDVSLLENSRQSSESTQFKQKLEANKLRFAFQDGKIENVCTTSGEDGRVLNIKRGILSTFQNSMAQLEQDGTVFETDVSGYCPTTYTSQSGIFSGLTIKKTKDILACTDRNGNISSIHSKRYMVPSKIQSVPLVKSTHSCEQDISSGKIDKTTCTEIMMFRPFSRDESGAVTKATQTLTFKTYTQRTASSSLTPIQMRSSLLFEHLYDESIDADAKTEVVNTLRAICSETSTEITKDTPILFGTLVSHMKRLSTEMMEEVYNSVNSNGICSNLRGKQFFYDAIPMVGTEASLALTQKLISEKVVQGAEADMWLTQLAFIPKPTYDMLTAIKPLLNVDTYKTKALLGVSTMVHKICETHTDCQSRSEVTEFISMLDANIGSLCTSATPEQRKQILYTLKAFGNAGFAATTSSVVGRCIANRDLDNEVRVAALQALRKMPCSVNRDDAMRIFQNAENDSEIRIHAFLAIMACPTPDVLTKVRMMLSGEVVNQVGSFVWTYLENLKETSTPLKQELAMILEDAKLREDFNIDVRKFSRNIEKSFFSEYLNVGAQLESNLIWSQNSYLPRSAMLNVSVDLFGSSINLMEVGGRVQGLERIVEKFFGPNGYFSQKNTKELMDNKRQTANYVSPFDTLFKTPMDKITTSMYVKLFGSDVAFTELDSEDWSKLQKFNFLDFLIKLSEPKKIDITKNYQFLDSSLVIPTIIGLPMNLTVNGTASISLDMNGNVDLRNAPRNLDINGHLKPSAAIVVSGLMGVDAMVTKSSMKMVAVMHTSTSIDGKIQIKDGQVFNVEMNTPQEKMEVFHVQTEFFMNDKKMNMPQPAKTIKKCSIPQVTKVFGMEMCVDVTLPKLHDTNLPYAPLTGPMNAQLFIEKKDTHKGYTFTAKYETDRQQVSGVTYAKRTVHLSVDTPGSQVDRKLLFEAIYDPAKMEASAQMMTPWKKFSWTGSLKNTVDTKQATALMKIDGTQEYSIDAKLLEDKKNVKTVWTPSLTISMPNKPTMSLTGSLELGSGKTLAAVDLKANKFTRKPITFNAALTQVKGGQAYNLDVNLQSDFLTTKLDSSVAIANNNYNGRASLEYSLEGRPTHRFTASGKFGDNSRGDLKSYTVQAGFIPTEYPQYAFSFDGSVQATTNHIDTSLTVEFNKDKIFLTHKSSKQGNLNALSLQSSTSFKYPNKNINYATEMSHEHNNNKLKSSGSLTYAPSKTVSASIDLDRSVPDTYTGEATVAYPGREINNKLTLNKLGDGERKMNYNAKWGEQADSEMTINASWKSNQNTHEITSDFKIPNYPVSLKATIRPDPKDFMGRVDLTYKRNTWSLSTQYKLDKETLTSSVSYICPHRTVEYDMSATMNTKRASLTGELKWDAVKDPKKMVSLSAEYNNYDQQYMKRDARATMIAPFGSYALSGEFERTGQNAINFNAEYSHDNTKCMLTGKLSETSGEISIDSPYIQYKSIKSITASYNMVGKKIEAELSWNPTSKVTATAEWPGSEYKMKLTTPFEKVPNAGLVVVVPTRTTPLRVSGNVGDNSVSFTLTSDYKTAEFSARYNTKLISGTYNINGQLDKFAGEASLTWNDQKLWSKFDVNTRGPITITLDMETPFKYQKISTTFKHTGTWTDFKTRAAFTWNDKQIKSTLNFSPKQADLTVKTPWKDVSAEYQYTGQPKSFTTYAQLKWDSDKMMRADLTFDMTNEIKGSFKLASPFYSTISGDFEHTGTWENFNNKLSLTWAPSKTMAMTSMLSTTNDIQAKFTSTSPYGTYEVTLMHSGSYKTKQWKNSLELKMDNKQPFTLYSEGDYNKYYELKAGMKNLPTKTLTSGELSFTHKPSPRSATTEATLMWNDNKKIALNADMSWKNGFSLTGTLDTPFYEQWSLSVVHQGKPTDFENTATVQWASNKKIAITTTLQTRYGFDAKMKIISPWRQMSLTAHQQGNANEFSSSATLSWETGKQITTTLEFSQVNEIKLKWDLKTPFDEVKDASIVLTHRGKTYDKFYNQLEATLNGKEARIGTSWDMTSGVSLKVVCVNPWKDFTAEMKYAGEPMNFTSSASFTMDNKNYEANLQFSTDSAVKINMELKPNVIEPITTSLTLSKTDNKLYISWGDGKAITADATFKRSGKDLTGKASFTTPFENFQTGEATFTHTGSLDSFRESLDASFNGKSADLEIGFTTFGTIKGDFTLRSPWYNANGNFKHDGNWQKFTNEAELTYASGKTIRSELNFSMNKGVDATWRFTSPFKSFEIKYNHALAGSNNLTAHAELTWDSTKRMSSDLIFNYEPSNIRAELTFTSPWKTGHVKYSHQGTMETRCTAHAELGWDGKTPYTADWSVSMLNGFTFSATIKTPWRDVSAEMIHKGDLKNFENTMSVTYETGKTITLTSEFKMSPDYIVKTTLTSPWKNAEFLYRHHGDLENFTCHLEAKADSTPVVADLSWKMVSGIEATFSTTNPWMNLSGEFKCNLDMSHHQSSLEFRWGQKKIDATFDFDMRSGYEGSFTVNTPWRNMKSEWNLHGELNDFNGKTMVSWETGKEITAEASFSNKQSSRIGSAKLVTPWRVMTADYQSQGPINNFDSTLNFSWENGKTITLYTKFSNLSGVTSEIKLTTPWRIMSADFTHEGTYEEFTCRANVSWESGKKIGAELQNTMRQGSMSTKASITSPWRDLSAEYSRQGTWKNFDTRTELKWDQDKTISTRVLFNGENGYDLKVTVNTPWKNVETTGKFEGDLKAFTTGFTFKWDDKLISTQATFSLKPLRATWTYQCPHHNLSATFSHDGETRNMNTEASFTYNGKEFKLVSNIDLRSGYKADWKLTTPQRTMTAGFEFRGRLEEFVTSAELSWDSDKKIEFTGNFKAMPLDGTFTFKSPFYNDLTIKFSHQGQMTDFNNKLFISWAPNKQIEATSNYKKDANSITGGATLKTPFYNDMSATIEHTGDLTNFNNKATVSWGPNKKIEATASFSKGSTITGSATLTTPFYDGPMEMKFTFNDKMNWNGEMINGSKKITFSTTGTFRSNLLELNHSFSSPYVTFSFELKHQGDYKNFTNSAEGKWNDKSAKMFTTFNMPERKMSQTLEVTGYEKIEWSADYTLTENSISADLEFAYGSKKVEVEWTGNVEWKKYKSVWAGTIKVTTPFSGYEENKLEGNLEYSGRLFNLVLNGYKGTPSAPKRFEIYFKDTSTTTRYSAEMYVKSTLYSDDESKITFNFSNENGATSAELVNDLKFYPKYNFEAKLEDNYSVGSSGMTGSGSLVVKCHHGETKIEYNMGSNKNMCETGFTYTRFGQQIMTYSQKTTWNDEYTKMDHGTTFKSKYEMFKDCEFKFSYDLTAPKKTFAFTVYNNPQKPIDFKSELELGDNMVMMAQMSTPWEKAKTMQLDLTVNKGTQPWSVKADGKWNEQTYTVEGRFKYSDNGVFDTGLTVKTPVQGYENLQISASNTMMNDQVKPHLVIQWASDKKIDLSATLAWKSLYKISVDLSTPFDRLRSLVTDITIDNKLPEKLNASFDFKTMQMSKKLSAELNFDKAATSLTMKMESPFQSYSSMEFTATLKPRLSALLKVNGQTWFNLSGNGRFDSWTSHDLEFTATYPFWNKYMHVKISNDFSLKYDNAISADWELEYMQGKTMTLKFNYKTTPNGMISLDFTSPFEKFESIKYSTVFEGTSTNWNENTIFEFYYGKITTRTVFSIEDGFAYHDHVTGEMKNGVDNFYHKYDIVFKGDQNKFDLEATASGSYLPEIKFSTSWQYDPVKLSLKASLNQYYLEYIHNGTLRDFSCSYTLRVPRNTLWYGEYVDEWKGGWTFRMTDNRLYFTTQHKCPHDNEIEYTLDGGLMDGKVDGTYKYDGKTAKLTSTYSRTEAPFRYEGKMLVEVGDDKYETGVTLTDLSFEFPIKVNDDEVFSIRARNTQNADMEYKPTIEVVVNKEKYEFDGMFKNEGEGLVRDFKLHMIGPKGRDHMIKMQFEFETQSSQLVPGDAKIVLGGVYNGEEKTVLDMTAQWGNDNAVITFVQPQPMKYSIDFSVSTKGQSGEIVANWDTTALNKNFKFVFDNKFVSYSKRTKSRLDIDVVYTGISRGFTSDLDWTDKKFSHRLTLDYNGKEIGYDLKLDHTNGCDDSLELISEWRSVKLTWTAKTKTAGYSWSGSSTGDELSFALYWDSARDMKKKISGTTTWENTGYHTYKWTTNLYHPALPKELVFTDTIIYDTNTMYFSFGKQWSFSTDTSKDVYFKFEVKKNGEWGVELKQDYNNIDFKFGTEFTLTGITHVHMKYKGTDGSIKTLGLKTKYDTDGKTAFVELLTPMKNLKLSADKVRGTWMVSTLVNNKKYQATLTIRPDDAYLLVQLMGPSNYGYKFEATRITNGYKLELTKMDGAKTTTEGLAAISMNENKTVNGKLYWNPALYSQIKNEVAMMRAQVNDAIRRMKLESTKEARNKVNSLNLGSDFEQIMPHYNTEVDNLMQDVQMAKSSINRGYDQDVFFMKTFDTMTSGYVQRIKEKFTTLETDMMNYYTTVIEPRLEAMGENTKEMRANLMMRFVKIENKINELTTTAAQKWMENTETINQMVESVNQLMHTYIDHVAEYISNHPTMDSVRKFRTQTVDKINTVTDMAYNRVSEYTDPQIYSNAIYQAHNFVNDKLANGRLSNIISASTVRDVSDTLMYKLKYYYDYYDVSDNMKMFLKHTRNVAAEYVNDYLNHYVDQALNDFKWKQYDLENGRIEFEFNIPTQFKHVEFARIKADLKHRINAVVSHMAKYHFNLKETFYMYTPQAFDQILPPYNAQAIIAGQHIRTFDRRDYDFSSGRCSYLLARDFHDGNFTVFVNYNGQEQSLTVHTNGVKIEIQQDNTVKMDDNKVELPLQFFNTTIIRLGHKIIVNNRLGVEVVCDNEHGVCSVEMSGFYFAKTGGLFGTFNNEPSDDWTMSNNRNTSDVQEFANSWSSRCIGSNTAQTFNPVKDTKEYRACSALFRESASSMSTCFGVIDATQAFHKCINDMSHDVTLTEKNGPCKAAKFYETACQFAGVSVYEPEQCVVCETPEATIETGQTIQLSRPVMSADIVFIVEEKMCNYNTDNKLPQLAKYMDKSLSSNGYSSIRFGLVGFGGEGVHDPSHTHTMDSKMFAPQSEFSLGTEALKFGAGENKDVFDAIEFAAQYPFRAGATKLIVVIPCSDCSTSMFSYRSVAGKLINEGITMHVLNEFSYEITVDGKNPETNYLFGIDNSAVFSVRDARILKGNTRLYPITSKPSDSCSSLALQTGGTVFDLNMMTKMRGTVIKNFQTVFANRLAMNTYPPTCMVCSCEYNYLFNMATSICRRC